MSVRPLFQLPRQFLPGRGPHISAQQANWLKEADKRSRLSADKGTAATNKTPPRNLDIAHQLLGDFQINCKAR